MINRKGYFSSNPKEKQNADIRRAPIPNPKLIS